jgi:WhiB family redox-sensing transcriptional regulator
MTGVDNIDPTAPTPVPEERLGHVGRGQAGATLSVAAGLREALGALTGLTGALGREGHPVNAAMGWRAHAACQGEDPELFFPVGTTGPAIEQAQRAMGFCRRCGVATECLEWALETAQSAGIWGGRTEDERHRLRRTWQRGRARSEPA